MHNFNDILKVIKKASLDAVETTKPIKIVYGKVTSIAPLQINVEQKMTLSTAQLILTRNVTDYEIEMTLDHMTENHQHTHTIESSPTGGGTISLETHSHPYRGRKKFMIHNSLTVGEGVVMLQMQGGQKFIVLDRMVKNDSQ